MSRLRKSDRLYAHRERLGGSPAINRNPFALGPFTLWRRLVMARRKRIAACVMKNERRDINVEPDACFYCGRPALYKWKEKGFCQKHKGLAVCGKHAA